MHYLTELGESNSLFIMKVGLSIDGFVLVKFTRSFAILEYRLEISESTPTVSQARIAARQQTWRLKPFDNEAFKSHVFSRRKVCRTRTRGVLFGSENDDICYFLKQNNQQHLFDVHHSKKTELCMKCRVCM